MSREHDVVALSGAEYDALLSEAEGAARLREELAALTARARELREAQRAYMQNRGNDEYGRKVAEAAGRLDMALAALKEGRDE